MGMVGKLFKKGEVGGVNDCSFHAISLKLGLGINSLFVSRLLMDFTVVLSEALSVLACFLNPAITS